MIVNLNKTRGGKDMKKNIILAVVIILTMILLVGCAGGDTTGDTTNESQKESEEDTVTTASIVNDEEAFKEAISADGEWIIATLNDLTFEEEIIVEGTFHDKGDPENEIYRKIAPYTQDDNHNVIERFTISAPKMIIKSPNTRYQAGTFAGDIVVEANGFSLSNARIEGNLYFAKEEYKSSADISEDSTVTGDIAVK